MNGLKNKAGGPPEEPTEVPDKGTQEILDEMERDKKKSSKSPDEPKPKDESEVEEETKGKGTDGSSGEEEEKTEKKKKPKKPEQLKEPEKPSDKQPIKPRSIRTVPFGRLQKEKDKVEKLKKKLKDYEEKPKDETKTIEQKKEEKDKVIKELADKFGVDEEDVRELAELVGPKPATSKLPPEAEKKLETVDKLEKEAIYEREDRLFSKEFNKDVLPLIKEKYPKISKKSIAGIKKKLHLLAFTEEYHRVPKLKTIYLGLSDELKPILKKVTAEGTKGGGQRGKIGINLTVEQPAKIIAQMTDKQFDTYSENMGKKSKKLKITRYVPGVGDIEVE